MKGDSAAALWMECEEEKQSVFYEFYWNDPIKGYEFVGTLPERRQDPQRITEESIIAWGKKSFFGLDANTARIFFIRVGKEGENK